MTEQSFFDLVFRSLGTREHFALRRYFLHREQVRRQFKRVYVALQYRKKNAPQKPSKNDLKELQKFFQEHEFLADLVFSEIHLLFVSIDNQWDMINVVLENEKLKSIRSDLYKNFEFNSFYPPYTEARNHFEHYNSRIPGGGKFEKIEKIKSSESSGERRNLGGLSGDYYTFGTKKYSIGREALERLNSLSFEFERRLEEYVSGFDN